ncbi:hypothetical protein Dimus_013267 [Dionaea muscipula]
MATPLKSTPLKQHQTILEDTPLLCPEPLAIDRSSQRIMPFSAVEKSSDSEEIQIVYEEKGDKPRRRSRRIAGTGENRRRDEEEDDLEESEEEEEEEEEESDLEKEEKDANPEESTPTGSKGEQSEKEVKDIGSESVEDFFDAEEGGIAIDGDTYATEGPTQPVVEKKSRKSHKIRRVDPSSVEPDYELIHVQA